MEEDTVVQRHFRDGCCPTLVPPSSASQLCIMHEWGLMIYYCFRGMIWICSKFSDSQKFARPRFHALIVFVTRWAPVFWKVATYQSTILFSASKLHMCSFFSNIWSMNYYLFLFDCGVRFCLQMLSKATFRTLALYILRLRCHAILNTYNNSLWFFGNVVFVVLKCVQSFWWFSHKPSEKNWAISPKGKHKLSKMTLSTFQKCLFELCSAFFFGCS